MNMNLKNRLSVLSTGPKSNKDKLELDKEILSARFLSEIQIYLDSKDISRKDFAKKMGVSASFVSQLFTSEKVVSIEFLAKVQQKLNLKFYISTIDQVALENFADKVSEKILNKIIEIENQNKKNQKEEEDGFWVFYSKEKPDYNNLDKSFIEESQLAVA